MSNILYKQLRGLPVYRSDKFLKWVKAKYPDRDMHHLIGAMTAIKLNDYLILPLTREEHIQAESKKGEFAVDNLPRSLNILFEYIKEIENEQII